ncbi:hypothetical protein HG531_002639 [Fusarium graminearum]|nr:hypothetical protein HG531_002639 [Fusarium graminearum]
MLQMPIRHTLILELCQLSCCSDGIANLSSVHLLLSQISQVPFDVVKVNVLFDLKLALPVCDGLNYRGLLKRLQSLKEICPNGATLGFAQALVVKRKLDARLESFIKSADTIGGENQDSFVVLENSKEHRDKSVTLKVCKSALLKKDIGFIE